MTYIEDDEWAKKHKSEFYPIKIFDEETGNQQNFLFSIVLIAVIRNLRVLNLADWSSLLKS
jgi:hypothetical protein